MRSRLQLAASRLAALGLREVEAVSASTCSAVSCSSTATAWTSLSAAPSSSIRSAWQSWTSSLGSVRSVHTPYSVKVGRSRPQPLPVLEKVKNQDNLRWQRSVVRLGEDVQATLQERTLLLTGKAGSLKVDLEKMDPTGLVAFKLMQLPGNKTLMLFASPNKERFAKFSAQLDSYVRGVSQGYLVGLTVKGVGYRMEPVPEAVARTRWYFDNKDKEEKSAINYPFNKPCPAIRLKVGYSVPAVYPLPPHIRAFFVKPTLMYLYGLNLTELRRTAKAIRQIRKPNAYTGNGIQFLDERLKLRQRASNKRG